MIKFAIDGIIILIGLINVIINCLFYGVIYLIDTNTKFYAWDYFINTITTNSDDD